MAEQGWRMEGDASDQLQPQPRTVGEVAADPSTQREFCRGLPCPNSSLMGLSLVPFLISSFHFQIRSPPLPLRRLYSRTGDFHSATVRGWRLPGEARPAVIREPGRKNSRSEFECIEKCDGARVCVAERRGCPRAGKESWGNDLEWAWK